MKKKFILLCLQCTFLLFYISALNAQKLEKDFLTHYKLENDQRIKISKKEFKKLIYQYPGSKSLYKGAQLQKHVSSALILTGMPVTFLGSFIIGFSEIDFGGLGGLSSNTKPRKKNYAPLILGMGMFTTGILVRMGSKTKMEKAISKYNSLENMLPDSPDHSNEILIYPGKIAWVYSFR